MAPTRTSRAVAVAVLFLLAVACAGALATTAVAADDEADLWLDDGSTDAATNHTWTTTYAGTENRPIENLTLDYGGSGTNLSDVAWTDVYVDVDGSSAPVDAVTVASNDEVLHVDVNDTHSPTVESGAEITVATFDDAVRNPSTAGDYPVSLALNESGTTFHAATATLSITQTLSGTVTDDAETAIGGATVSVWDESTGYYDQIQTDADGSYVLGVPVGTYDVTAEADGYASVTEFGVAVGESNAATQHFSLAEAGTIEVQVVDADTGAGIADAWVDVDDGEGPLQAFRTDGDGNVSVDVGPGNYTVRASPDLYAADEAAVEVVAGETTTVTLTHARIAYDASVEQIAGDPLETMPTVSVTDTGGLVQVDLQNETSRRPQELAGLGADESTAFRVTVNLTDAYEPRLLIGTMREGTWERTANGSGTDVVIEGSPTEQQFMEGAPRLSDWPDDGSDAADHEYSAMFSAAIDDLAYPETNDTHAERLNGTIMMTDAQVFSTPRYETVDGEDALSLTIAAPHYDVHGSVNDGFYEAFLPDALLDHWGVDGVEDLSAAYKGEDSEFDATDVDGGIRISLDVTYSAANVSIAPAADDGGDGGDDGGDDGDDGSGGGGGGFWPPSDGSDEESEDGEEDEPDAEEDPQDEEPQDDESDETEDEPNDEERAEPEDEPAEEPADEPAANDESEDDETPGFGAGVALLALLVAAGLRLRERDD